MFRNKNEIGITAVSCVVIAVVFNLLGTVILKFFAEAHKTFAAVVLYLTVISVVFGVRIISWLLIGRWFQLSYIYPFMSINYVLGFLLGFLLFQEPFSLARLFGSIIISIGVVVLSLSPHKTEKARRL